MVKSSASGAGGRRYRKPADQCLANYRIREIKNVFKIKVSHKSEMAGPVNKDDTIINKQNHILLSQYIINTSVYLSLLFAHNMK